jgi:hypothetical protein
MSNMRFSEAMQLSVSTAEEEMNYSPHRESPATLMSISVGPVLPSGIYRVIDGSLCRVLPGLPPDENLAGPSLLPSRR